jgi:hypothetical protein
MPVEPIQTNTPKPPPTFGEDNSVTRHVYEKLSKAHHNPHEHGWIPNSVPTPEQLLELESDRTVRFVSRLAEALVAKKVITETEMDELLKGIVPQKPKPKALPSPSPGPGEASIPPPTEVKQYDWQQPGYDWRQHVQEKPSGRS